MAPDSLKNACEKLRVDYHRFFHVGQGRSFPQNFAIQFDLSSRHIHRPERVSERLVYRKMGLLGHQLENMPRCKAIFE